MENRSRIRRWARNLMGFPGVLVTFGFFGFLPDQPFAIHPVQVIARNPDV
jgi:hypothetical protein